MDKNILDSTLKMLERTAKALRENNMAAYICETKEDALRQVEELLCDGAKIGSGGSMSLQECGVMELLKSGRYNFIDRTTYPAEKMGDCYADMYTADFYLCSSNAVTEKGELYNVDGNGNRVSAMIYGPESVVVVVGANKIVADIDAAITRVKKIAAPVRNRSA